MTPYDRSTNKYSTETYKSGAQTTGQRQCTDVDKLTANPANSRGDFHKPNGFSMTKTTSTGLRGRARRLDSATVAPSVIINVSGPIASKLDTKGLLFSGVKWDAAYQQANNALTTSVRGDLDVSIDLFQWRQLQRTAIRVWDLTNTLNKQYKRAIKKTGPHKELANLYLEWTYGIAPTLETMLGLYKKLHQDGLVGNPLIHCRGRGSVQDKADSTQAVAMILPTTGNVQFQTDSSYRCQLDIYLKPDLSAVQALSGYTSLSPISWLYELTAYSFVLDWFWNLGGYFRDMETTILHQSRFAYGSDSRSLKQVTTVTTSSVVNGAIELSELSGTHTFIGMDRFILSSYPVPKLPTWQAKMGARRLLNAAALLTQFLPDLYQKMDKRRVSAALRTRSKPFVL